MGPRARVWSFVVDTRFREEVSDQCTTGADEGFRWAPERQRTPSGTLTVTLPAPVRGASMRCSRSAQQVPLDGTHIAGHNAA